jgi:lipid-binding SYLF domain-containing protein
MKSMKVRIAGFLTAALVGVSPLVSTTAAQSGSAQTRQELSDEAQVITESMEVLRELTATPDKGIPNHLLQRAEAIIVIPSLVKGGFIVGGKHGKGIVSVRDRSTRQWTAPAIVKLTGGSIGWQIGLEKVDLAMLVMNRSGVDELLADKFTLGGSASVTAGPVGRSADAATNAQMGSKILAYSRAQGLFAGAALEGAKLHADDDDNAELYGEAVRLRDVLNGKVSTTPKVAETWREFISRVTK